MPSLVLRLWVIMLAVLFQVGSWQPPAPSMSFSAAVPLPEVGDFDAPEESSEEPSAVDDTGGADVAATGAANWGIPAAGGGWHPWAAGLAPGFPPTDTPFKPPRA